MTPAKTFTLRKLFLFWFLSRLLAGTSMASAISVSSPDGAVIVTLDNPSGNLIYTIAYRGTNVVESSPLGVTVNGLNLGTNVNLIGSIAYATNETFVSRHGIHALAENYYQGLRISVNAPSAAMNYFLNVRVYNNGAAFRYEFGSGKSENITAESSSFVIPAGSMVWSQNNTSVYEAVYSGNDIASVTNNTVMGPPVTIQLSGTNGFLALTESTPGVFGSPYLVKVSDATGRRLQVVYPVNADNTTGASVSGSVETPWNVIMVGADLNSLVNNDIVESLAPAPDPVLFPDGTATSWATTGRSVWDWLQPQPGGITWTNAMTNSLWAARLGFEYNTVDDGWASWNGGNPWPQVQSVVNFSHALGIKVLLWKTSSELATFAQQTNFFQQLQTYGVDGFKADFFDFNSVSASARERVQLQANILSEAAGYHLVASFHGSTKPMGQFRTYPNLIEVEAVFGKEQGLSSVQTMPAPFTRFLAGPADFTPMEFSGNKAYEIANPINMPGPIITYAERSDLIAASPFAPLIRAIPSTWDETIVLPQSRPGQTVATARRKGSEWFIGIMNTLVVQGWNFPLTFLDSNVTYQAQIIRETSSILEHTNVTCDSIMPVTITSTGGSGFVARFFQATPFTLSTNQLLTGTVIGTAGSFAGAGNTKEKAFDGDVTTFFDAPDVSGDWVGLDLGSSNQMAVSTLRYYPRNNWATRMVSGIFQGANASDFSDAVNLYTVGYTPPEGTFTTITLTNQTVFRYLRYVSPSNGSCNVSEIQFYGVSTVPTNITAQIVAGSQITLSWPITYTGWRLWAQTNAQTKGLGSNWAEVVGATITNQMTLPIVPGTGSVFYRLTFP